MITSLEPACTALIALPLGPLQVPPASPTRPLTLIDPALARHQQSSPYPTDRDAQSRIAPPGHRLGPLARDGGAKSHSARRIETPTEQQAPPGSSVPASGTSDQRGDRDRYPLTAAARVGLPLPAAVPTRTDHAPAASEQPRPRRPRERP